MNDNSGHPENVALADYLRGAREGDYGYYDRSSGIFYFEKAGKHYKVSSEIVRHLSTNSTALNLEMYLDPKHHPEQP